MHSFYAVKSDGAERRWQLEVTQKQRVTDTGLTKSNTHGNSGEQTKVMTRRFLVDPGRSILGEKANMITPQHQPASNGEFLPDRNSGKALFASLLSEKATMTKNQRVAGSSNERGTTEVLLARLDGSGSTGKRLRLCRRF